MQFLISDTFNGSLTKLTNSEQKAVKTTAFDLQLDPSRPGLKLHRVERAKDLGMWTVRAGRDLRIVVHKSASSFLLCYTGHHDDAYAWAQRRRIEQHPRTGAAQIVEVRETIEEAGAIGEPVATIALGGDRPFADLDDDTLLAYGIPIDWLASVRQATDDSLLDLATHLPQEAAEALLDLATGTTPRPPVLATPETTEDAVATMAPDEAVATIEGDAFSHPDAQRRFRVIENVAELERALEWPWERWTVFLHPAQREVVERDYSGPARVAGSAGTGKTIVALHRAVRMARQEPAARVLLTTFSRSLAHVLRTKLERLAGNEPEILARITIGPIAGIAYDLHAAWFGQPNMAPASVVRSLIQEAAASNQEDRFSATFLQAEWADVVDVWQLATWEDYRDVTRLGRKTRLGGRQREALWTIFEQVRAGLKKRGMMTWPALFGRLSARLETSPDRPFDIVVVDEAQDLAVPELRFLSAMAGGRGDGLFFTGDLGQRIFQQPFSWKALGVDVRGRSTTLRVNYRTSHQIRARADRLLPAAIADVDGIAENRRGAISVFNGPPPDVDVLDDREAESRRVGAWITERLSEGLAPQEIAIFVRDVAQRARARAAVKAAGAKHVELDESVETTAGRIAIGTMHLAKGLEFRAVVVMACDDEVIPSQERIETVTDASDLEEVYDTERHLLYVACTRARDHLLVTGVEPASEFLGDLGE